MPLAAPRAGSLVVEPWRKSPAKAYATTQKQRQRPRSNNSGNQQKAMFALDPQGGSHVQHAGDKRDSWIDIKQTHASRGGGNSNYKRSSSVAVKRGRGGNHVASSHNSHARKRKAEENLDQRSTQRMRLGADEPLLTENYIRKNLGFPSSADLPGAPKELFGSNLVREFSNTIQGGIKIRRRFETLNLSGGKMHRCILSGDVPGMGRVEAPGDGPNNVLAVKAAFTHFIAKLHSAGLMREVYPPPEESSYNAEDMVSEGDAKVDVYNYAAQFGLIPRFSHRAVKRALFSTRGKMSHDYTVELPEQAIKVSARASTIEQAEIAASVHFKAAAEKYQAEHGDESIVINSSDALNTSNIKDFMRYYQFSIKGTRFDVSLKKDGKQRRGSNRWLAQATVNDEAVGEPVAMQNKKRAEDLAYLTCAVKLCNSEPKVMEGFRAAMRASGGSGFLEPVRPVGVQLDTNAVKAMEKTLRRCRAAGLTDRTSEVRAEKGEVQDTRQARMRRPLSGAQLNLKNKELTSRKRNFESDKSLAELRKKRAELPMTQYSDKVINLIKDNPYSIIIGATGSGKTTQVPQILLDHAIAEGNGAECNIICTQPRRIAATSVARRVAVERNEDLRESIGYHVRFDAKPPQLGGSINYCTTGILLQQLQHHPDDIYDTTSHIIIDEVHERDIPVDFLLVMLKKSMQARVDASRSVPKVTLMSATLDTELFASYFKRKGPDGQMMGCPSLSVPGRTFPVAEKYLGSIMEELGQTFSQGQLASMKREKETREFIDTEDRFVPLPPLPASFEATEEEDEVEATIDWKNQRIVSARGEVATGNEREEGLVPFALTAATIAHIARTSEGGAILVFLPGLDEIKKVDEYLRTESWLGINPRDTRKYKVFMLHSSLPESQTEVFDPVPPGCRKIILSTNIAETSVTIPDVQYVVDSGKLREKRYDQVRRITKLQCTWISKSNSKQRAGRAGRVQNGNYYALFSKQRFDSFRAIGLPEMLRSDLQEICLDIKSQAFQMPIRQFLAEAIEPPSPTAVEVSVRNLIGLQALTEEEDLTPLGRLLSSLPVHPSLGKMIVLGVIFRCLDSMLILGAAAAERPLWVMPMDKKREANAVRKEFAQDSNSDHIALINAYRSVRKIGHYGERHAFASSKFIHSGAFRAIEGTMEQIEEVLVTAGLITTTSKLARRDFQLGSPELNANSDDMAMIKSLAVAGLHPNLAISTGNVTFRTPGEKNVMVHGSSVNAVQGRRTRTESRPATRLLTYSTMLKNQDGSSYSLRDTSVTSPIMAILFGGKLHLEGNVMRMDKWLPFYVESSRDTVKTLWTFKNALDRLLTTAFQDLQNSKSAQRRGTTFADDPIREKFASGLVDVLKTDLATHTNSTRYVDDPIVEKRAHRYR